MGKATIQSSSGQGQYSILYHRNSQRMEDRISKLTQEISTLTTVELPVTQAALDSINAALAALLDQLDVVIADGDEEAIRKCSSEINTARVQKGAAESALARLKMKILSLEKYLSFLQNNKPQDQAMTAWCADLNENLAGVVGTMEVPGEANTIIIKPGGQTGSGSAYSISDGMVTPSMAVSPDENFYNLAMLPGWQKWQPTYRIGVITALDGNLCDINLDPATSSQQDLDVNIQDIYGDVPIEYMSCNGGAFRVGDRVVVKFTGSGPGTSYTPKVIGFESNPKGCGFLLQVVRGDGVTIDSTIGATFTVKNSFGTTVAGMVTTYKAATQQWELAFPSGYIPAVGNTGYWVYCSTSKSLETQYPMRYKYADYGQSADLIQPGTYTFDVPLWDVGSMQWTPYTYTITEPNVNIEVTDTLLVKSSIPFEVTTYYWKHFCPMYGPAFDAAYVGSGGMETNYGLTDTLVPKGKYVDNCYVTSPDLGWIVDHQQHAASVSGVTLSARYHSTIPHTIGVISCWGDWTQWAALGQWDLAYHRIGGEGIGAYISVSPA